MHACGSPDLHLLKCVDAENRESLLQDPRGQVAQKQPAGALFGLGLEDGTVFVKASEMAGKVVEVVTEKVRAIFVGDSFEDETEIEEVFGKREFLRRSQ